MDKVSFDEAAKQLRHAIEVLPNYLTGLDAAIAVINSNDPQGAPSVESAALMELGKLREKISEVARSCDALLKNFKR